MSRRTLAVGAVAIIALALVLSACGSKDPFVGDWKQSDQGGTMYFHVDAPKNGVYDISWSNGTSGTESPTADTSEVMHFQVKKTGSGVYSGGDPTTTLTLVGDKSMTVEYMDTDNQEARANFTKQ